MKGKKKKRYLLTVLPVVLDSFGWLLNDRIVSVWTFHQLLSNSSRYQTLERQPKTEVWGYRANPVNEQMFSLGYARLSCPDGRFVKVQWKGRKVMLDGPGTKVIVYPPKRYSYESYKTFAIGRSLEHAQKMPLNQLIERHGTGFEDWMDRTHWQFHIERENASAERDMMSRAWKTEKEWQEIKADPFLFDYWHTLASEPHVWFKRTLNARPRPSLSTLFMDLRELHIYIDMLETKQSILENAEEAMLFEISHSLQGLRTVSRDDRNRLVASVLIYVPDKHLRQSIKIWCEDDSLSLQEIRSILSSFNFILDTLPGDDEGDELAALVVSALTASLFFIVDAEHICDLTVYEFPASLIDLVIPYVKNPDSMVESYNQLAPLHSAVLKNRREAVTLLANHQCDVDITTDHGETPLHLAVIKGNL